MTDLMHTLIEAARKSAAVSQSGFGGAHEGRFSVLVEPTQSRGPRKALHQDRLSFRLDGKRVSKEVFADAAR